MAALDPAEDIASLSGNEETRADASAKLVDAIETRQLARTRLG